MRKHWKKIVLAIALLILIILTVMACSSGIVRIEAPAETTVPTVETTVPVETTLPAEETTAPSEPEEETVPPTTEISITEPDASEPNETEPSGTEAPAAKEPAKNEPETTKPPATDPPEEEPAVTDPPATDPTETEPPVTDPPTTEPPATDSPATEPTECTHSWKKIWHPEEGHYGDYYYRCKCGAKFESPEAVIAHIESYDKLDALTYHTSWQSAQDWIVDVPDYYEWVCTKCGERTLTQP